MKNDKRYVVNIYRQHFFDIIVHKKEWKDSLCGRNEKFVIDRLENIGFKLNQDFMRQHPLGQRFVVDIAFVKEQVAIEVDGKDHLQKEKRKMDRKRDSYMRSNNWCVIRIDDRDFKNAYKQSFYMNLIKEVVLERRRQYEDGKLYPIDFSKFSEEDYE